MVDHKETVTGRFATMRSFSIALSAIAVCSMCVGAWAFGFVLPLFAQSEYQERRVPFLTLRNRTNSTDPGEFYGDERSDPKAGWCRVRELDLDVPTPLVESAPVLLREELISVDQVRQTDWPSVLGELQVATEGASPIIFVHGYYISFEKGCRRAVLLQENAKLNGRLLWFSWPSDGDFTSYMHDESDLYWSVPDLADTLLEMESRFGKGHVDLIGHSLGSRGVLLALYDVASRTPDARFGDVVLLAPDIDFDIFVRYLPAITSVVESLTVYVTSADHALALSAQLHGYPRLGETGNDISKLDGVEFIDLSELSTGSPTGHLYHISSKAVGEDLSQLLSDGKSADARKDLSQSGANIWKLMRQ